MARRWRFYRPAEPRRGLRTAAALFLAYAGLVYFCTTWGRDSVQNPTFWPATGVVVYRDGEPVASGLMAISHDIVITGNVITDPTRRRQGLAAAMMRTGLHWAHEAGAKIAALNVQADNAAAKALYAGLGYRHQYDYSYRLPGAPK